MKFNQWTLGLAAVGAVSLASAAYAEEKMSMVETALSSTTLSGYVDTSAQWNLGSGNANVPNYAYSNGKADGFNLNVVELSLEKKADATDQWGAGYRVDLLFGPDSNVGVGLGTSSSGASGDFAIRQAYVDLKAPLGNGLDIKVGVFNTIIGYEAFESGSNPNVTRSYGYTIEPTTHTGILLTYQFCDEISASVGVANTYGPTINQKAYVNNTIPSGPFGPGGDFLGTELTPRPESYKTYMASVTLTAPKDWGFIAGSSLYAGVINGFNANSPTQAGFEADETSFYVGASVNTPLKELKLGASYDYEGNSKQESVDFNGSGYANAVALYATYQATDKLSFNTRGEYATQTPGNAGFDGVPAKVFDLTETVEYDLWKNVLSRVEIRWDHAADGHKAYGGVYEDYEGTTSPDKKNSYELIASIVYKF